MINYNGIFGLIWMGYKNNPLIKGILSLLKESKINSVYFEDFK
jgi:hypothetical protein